MPPIVRQCQPGIPGSNQPGQISTYLLIPGMSQIFEGSFRTEQWWQRVLAFQFVRVSWISCWEVFTLGHSFHYTWSNCPSRCSSRSGKKTAWTNKVSSTSFSIPSGGQVCFFPFPFLKLNFTSSKRSAFKHNSSDVLTLKVCMIVTMSLVIFRHKGNISLYFLTPLLS